MYKNRHNSVAKIINTKSSKEIEIDNFYNYLDNLYLNLSNGYISIFNKGSKSSRWSVGIGDWDKLQNFKGKENIYFSVNSLICPGKHTSKYIKNLNALFLDLDFYNIEHLKNLKPKQVWNLIKLDLDFPEPSFVVDSGRGLYLIWCLENTFATVKSKRYWRDVETLLIDKFKDFGADQKVKDPARVLRIPGTINPKSNTMVTILEQNEIRYEIADIEKYYRGYNISSPEKIKEPKKAKNKPKSKNKITTLKTTKNLHYTRARDLETLVNLRADKPQKGVREQLLFIYRLQLLMSGVEPKIALEKTLELNNIFLDPLQEKEVIKATATAETNAILYFNLKDKYKKDNVKIRLDTYLSQNGVYLYNNKSIIEVLDITEKEMEHLDNLINTEVKKARKNKYYLDNREEILDYKKDKYRKNLKKKNKKSKKEELEELREKIKSLRLKGLKNKEIMSMLGITSTTTLERHIKHLKENGLI